MELLISWGIGILIILAFLLPYVIRMRKNEAKAKKRLEISRSTGRDKAISQHPILNKSLCIGCGICVDSCPEGDVLGIIDGKAMIINGSHCVGHGLCAENCPVGGIEIGLGDISQREDIPQLTPDYETNLPGIFIIGELGGMALIRNAIEQGVNAINHIAKQKEGPSQSDFDIGIVGAGPAGLAAALQAKKIGLSFIIIDQNEPGGTILQYPRQKFTMVQKVTLPLYGELDRLEYTKEELLEIWEQVIIQEKLDINIKNKLLSVTGEIGNFILKTDKNEFNVDRVLLALGRRGTPRKLGVPGEELGKVMYKLMDAGTYQDNQILVVGGGDSAIESAVGLSRQKGNTVTLSYRKSNFFRLKARNEKNINEALEGKKIKVLFNSNLKKIDQTKVEIEVDGQVKSINNDYIFIFAGGELPFPLLNSIGIKFGEKIEVIG